MKPITPLLILLAGVATVEGQQGKVSFIGLNYSLSVTNYLPPIKFEPRPPDGPLTNINLLAYTNTVQIGTNYYTVKEIEQHAKFNAYMPANVIEVTNFTIGFVGNLQDFTNIPPQIDNNSEEPMWIGLGEDSNWHTNVYRNGRMEQWTPLTNIPPSIKWQFDLLRWSKTPVATNVIRTSSEELGYRSDGTVVWRTPPEAKK